MDVDTKSVSIVIFCGILLVSGLQDIYNNKISNWITYPGILSGIAVSAISANTISWSSSIIGVITAFFVFLLLFISGYLGGGDVKLMMVVGAFLGFPQVIDAVFYSIVFGSVIAVLSLGLSKQIINFIKEFFYYVRSLIYPGLVAAMPATDQKIPMGVAIAIAVYWILLFPEQAITPYLLE